MWPGGRRPRPGAWRRPWPRPATGHPSIGCTPPAGPVAPTGGAWSGGMAGAGCGWSPTPVVPTSCGFIWPGWVIQSWGILSMAMPAVAAPMAGCGSMPGDSIWCIRAPVRPSASRLPCPGTARHPGRSRCPSDLPRSPGGAWNSSALTQEFLPGGGWPAQAPGGAARQGTGGGRWRSARPRTDTGLVGPGARPPDGVGPGRRDARGWCGHGRFGHADAEDALKGGCGYPWPPGDCPAARGRSPGPDGVGGLGDGRSQVSRGSLGPC